MLVLCTAHCASAARLLTSDHAAAAAGEKTGAAQRRLHQWGNAVRNWRSMSDNAQAPQQQQNSGNRWGTWGGGGGGGGSGGSGWLGALLGAYARGQGASNGRWGSYSYPTGSYAPPMPSTDASISGLIRSDSRAAANAIVNTGDLDGAAWSLLDAARGGSASNVANVFAIAAGMNQGRFTDIFVRCAAMAMTQGGDVRSGFEEAAAGSFAAASSYGTIAPLAMSMTDCILKGKGYGWQYGNEYAKMVSSLSA